MTWKMSFSSRSFWKGPVNSEPMSVSRRDGGSLPCRISLKAAVTASGVLVVSARAPKLLAEDVENHQDVLELSAWLRREVGQVGHPAIVDVCR